MTLGEMLLKLIKCDLEDQGSSAKKQTSFSHLLSIHIQYLTYVIIIASNPSLPDNYCTYVAFHTIKFENRIVVGVACHSRALVAAAQQLLCGVFTEIYLPMES